MSPIEFFVILTMILAVMMFVIIIVIANAKRNTPKHDYSAFPAIACCCIGGIVIVMISMLTFLLAHGFGQYLFV